ncbi:MAG: glycosyltransferase [Anaerolineaceae bacterium]
MSLVINGEIQDSVLTKNARGGTELMRDRFLKVVDPDLLQGIAVHFSRPQEPIRDMINILYCHDLAGDPATNVLHTQIGKDAFAAYVFVSYWQRDQFIARYDLDLGKCIVIENAIEQEYIDDPAPFKDQETLRFIYHTTPHRGLELAVPIFQQLAKTHQNIHFDVYSSFDLYGWPSRNEPYQALFKTIEDDPNMTYHGSVSNGEILEALKKSHFFLYPCIWPETSCLAMIEAIACGVISIYSAWGALPETGKSWCNTGMHTLDGKSDDLAVLSLEATKHLLKSIEVMGRDEFFRHLWNIRNPSLFYHCHSLQTYKTRWDILLSTLKGHEFDVRSFLPQTEEI